MTDGQSLNLGWQFCVDFKESYITQNDFSAFESINIPHTVKDIPYDCYDQTMTCMISTYARRLTLPAIAGKTILLAFDGVSACYSLYINGALVCTHKGAYSSELYDITAYVHEGENFIVMAVDSNERSDVPPNGATVDYLIYGGIYRDVTLYIKGKTYIKNTLFRYEMKDTIPSAFPEVFFEHTGDKFNGTLRVSLKKDDKDFYDYEQEITVTSAGAPVLMEKQFLPPVSLWNPAEPELYDVTLTLTNGDAVLV